MPEACFDMTPHPVAPKARVSDATGTARQTTRVFWDESRGV